MSLSKIVQLLQPARSLAPRPMAPDDPDQRPTLPTTSAPMPASHLPSTYASPISRLAPRTMPRARSPSPVASTSGPARKIRKGFQRSRKGCLTCRRYHLKCPEIGDSCAKCLEAHRNCEWPDNVLKERADLSARGDVVEPSLVVATTSAEPLEMIAPTTMAPDDLTTTYLLSLISPTLLQPLEPCSVAYPDPTQRRLMHLFVGSASKLIVNISLRPTSVSFLDLSRLLTSPETGFSGDALRFSVLGIGALHEGWSHGSVDLAVRNGRLGVAKGMADASAACLAATVALGAGEGGGGGLETALAAAAMLSYSQVLAGVHGKRKALEVAYGLVQRGGGVQRLLERATAKGEMRKVLEFIAVFDVLDALGTQREPQFIGASSEVTWWPRSCCETSFFELDSVETTFGVSREMWSLFARAVRLVARSTAASRRDGQTLDPSTLCLAPLLLPTHDNDDDILWDLSILAEAAALDEDLERWETTPDRDLALPRAYHGNRIYILTAKVLLEVSVRGEARGSPAVQEAACAILNLLIECHAKFDGVLYFMWPLLVAGSQIDLQTRPLARKVLEIFSETYLFDCTAALQALTVVWERIDQDLPDATVQAVVCELGYQFL